MSYGEFVPLGETSGLLDANGEIFQVYDNIMKALADQVRRITKNGNKLGIVAMTELLRGVDTSVDTSDATAIAEYILKDYTAYVNGKKIVGTMPYIEGKTITPSDTDIVAVPAGTYVMGDIIVKAVENVTPDEPDEPDEPDDPNVEYDYSGSVTVSNQTSIILNAGQRVEAFEDNGIYLEGGNGGDYVVTKIKDRVVYYSYDSEAYDDGVFDADNYGVSYIEGCQLTATASDGEKLYFDGTYTWGYKKGE